MRLLSNQVKRLIAVFALITAACLGVIILSAVRVVNTRDASCAVPAGSVVRKELPCRQLSFCSGVCVESVPFQMVRE